MANGLFLKLGTGEDQILGECRSMHHVGWIELLAFFPVARLNVTAAEKVGDKKQYRFGVTKLADNVSGYLASLDYLRDRNGFHSVVIDSADLRTGLPQRRFEFSNVSIPERPTFAGQGHGNQAIESVTFEYEDMLLNNHPIPD